MYSTIAPRAPAEHSVARLAERSQPCRCVCLWLLQVDAENAIATTSGDNFITWHIRQFMDDPAATTALFYKHVTDRKAAADHVYVARRSLQLQPYRRCRHSAAGLSHPLCFDRHSPGRLLANSPRSRCVRSTV
jgi:hypothetical protein